MPPQVNATPGMPERKAVGRRQARVREIMHSLPPAAQEAIRADLDGSNKHAPSSMTTSNTNGAHEEAPTASIPVSKE
ncbi:hypothetical protein ASD37_23405 [Mycobacterium sp. Root135]|nr:hypothetical protein ASD37_23405 [Mycobacterium sp. Root135]